MFYRNLGECGVFLVLPEGFLTLPIFVFFGFLFCSIQVALQLLHAVFDLLEPAEQFFRFHRAGFRRDQRLDVRDDFLQL